MKKEELISLIESIDNNCDFIFCICKEGKIIGETKIIRLLQNYIQLKHIALTDKRNKIILEQWQDIADTMYKVAEKLDELNK